MKIDKRFNRLVASLYDIQAESEDVWRPEELPDVLAHQLSIPISDEFKRAGVDDGTNEGHESDGQVLTFGSILLSNNPEIHLLRGVKLFAERMHKRSNSTFPRHISTLLFYWAVAQALIVHGEKITSLTTPELQTGLKWVTEQVWADEPCRQVCTEAQSVLT